MRIAFLAMIVTLLMGAIINTNQRLAELQDAQLSQAGQVAEVRRELKRVEQLAHPEVIQKRTIDYILRQGEFHGSP